MIGPWQLATRLAALIATFVLVVAACGAAATPSPSATAPGATSTPAGSPTEGPRTGGTLSIAWQSDIAWFDPAIGYDVTSWPAERLIFEQLVTYDRGTTIIPLLAEALPKVSADGKTYTFTLRSGVKFVKRDGSVLREVTADDFPYSINRVLDPNLKPKPSPVSSSFFSVIAGAQDVIDGKTRQATGVKAPDARTVEFTLTRPDPTFVYKLASPFGSVVPKELAGEDTSAFSADPVGTGPFFLKAHTKGQAATFVRNPSYWQPGKPDLDGVDFRVGVDATAALQQVQAGTLDLLGDAIPAGAFQATINDPALKDRIYRSVDVATIFLIIDTSGPSPALANVKVRQALQSAIDKENVVKLYQGRGAVANCIFPPALPGYDPNCHPYPYAQDKAKEMLADAGYAKGFSTTIYTDTTDPDPAVAQAIQQDLKAIGIEAKVEVQSFDVLVGTLTTPHAAPLMYLGWFQDYPDPSDFIDPIFSCAVNVSGAASYGWYCNKEVDALSEAAKSEQNREKYLATYQEIQRRIMQDSPVVPINHTEHATVVSERVGTFFIHPVWAFDLAQYSLKP